VIPENIDQSVKQIVAEMLEITREAINDEDSVSDLGEDLLDFVERDMQLEKTFELQDIDPSSLTEATSAKQVIDHVPEQLTLKPNNEKSPEM